MYVAESLQKYKIRKEKALDFEQSVLNRSQNIEVRIQKSEYRIQNSEVRKLDPENTQPFKVKDSDS